MTAATATTADTFRPALHYTAGNTWLNDPNGLIFGVGDGNICGRLSST